MTPTFVYLHVGQDPAMPAALVQSLRARNPSARIIQCADPESPSVGGVEAFRLEGDVTRLMDFRLRWFAALQLRGPAMYLDADMLCVQPIDPAALLGDAQVALCRREYSAERQIGAAYAGVEIHEYAGRAAGDVWPYVACCTVTADARFWADCLANLEKLDPKFSRWYGDQEAIRNVAASGQYRVRELPESAYGRLLDESWWSPASKGPAPALIHFKGMQRKRMMLDYAARHLT